MNYLLFNATMLQKLIDCFNFKIIIVKLTKMKKYLLLSFAFASFALISSCESDDDHDDHEGHDHSSLVVDPSANIA